MPTATVTVREVKNKETGIDITVPAYKPLPGIISATYVYHVVVVSNLAVFKSPKHKETDNVQFMVERKFSDFENLHENLNIKFSGTIFPPLPKKVLLINDTIAKHRRGKFEHFLKFLASVPKISTSSVVLEFLGVGSIKAGTFRSGDIGEGVGKGHNETVSTVEDSEEQGPETSLFENEDEDEPEELFAVGETEAATNSADGDAAQLFESQDFGGGLTEDDAELFLPDAVVEKTSRTPAPVAEESDPSLFQIEDDLEEMLKLEMGKKTKKHQPGAKPSLQPKPNLHPKPSLQPKPTLQPKPDLQPKPTAKTDDTPEQSPAVSTDKTMSGDDIMSYIQENAAADDTDLDLFS